MRYRNPAYTGQNRCWPCTVLNVGLTILVAVVLEGVGQAGIATLTVVLAMFVIGVRGYLIPGTPTLTRKLPEPVLGKFRKPGFRSTLPVTEALIASKVLDDNLALAEDTADSICERAKDFIADRELLEEAALDVFPDAVETTVRRSLGGGENWFVIDADQKTILQWEATPIAAIDVANAEQLSNLLPDWETRSRQERTTLLALVRYGIPRCPFCETVFVEPDISTVVCCGGRSLVGERRCECCGYALVDRNDLPRDVRGEKS